MTTESPTTFTTGTTAESELAAAFAEPTPPTQETGDVTQVQGKEGESTPASRATSTTTDASRTEETQPDALLNLTLDELLAHPTLGKTLQSWKDTEAAKQMRGQSQRIEQQVREQVQFESARSHFASLTPEELGEELASSKDAAAMYGRIQATPEPPPPLPVEARNQITYFSEVIHTANLALADLSPEVQAELDPTKHLVTPDGGDPAVVLAAWKSKVDAAVVSSRVASALAKTSSKQQESDKLEADAAADATRPNGPLLTVGTNSFPLPDLIETRADLLLEDAFRRVATQPRR